MKNRWFIILALLAIVITVAALPGFARFRLESKSPSGNSKVVGLRFQGQKPHPLDGTLRLFVTHHQKETRQQTSIPWEKDVAIRWQENSQGEAFVVEKSGRALIGFKVDDSGLKCTLGAENLADDPYAAKAE